MAIAYPDVGAALRLYLADCTDLVSLYVSNRIFLEWPSNFIIPTATGQHSNCIMVEAGKGGPGPIGLGQIQERIDVKYYGANRKTANDMCRLGNGYLMPASERVKTSFTKARCLVYKVEIEGIGLRLVESGAANWPYTLATYMVTYSGVQIT